MNIFGFGSTGKSVSKSRQKVTLSISYMSQKVEKPILQGQRIKTRKRDEKEKYDPSLFRDAVIQGITEAGPELDQVSKYLDSAGSKLDYRRYAEALLDILFAGGLLAPGGSIQEDADPGKPYSTDICVFGAENTYDGVKAYYNLLYKLIRRYKYIERTLDEELKKLIMFLKGFSEDARANLATVIGICLANNLGNPACLNVLFEDHLVKDGLSIEFTAKMFQAWLKERDLSSISSALKRAGVESKLLNLLPINKRTQENFENHFKAAGLDSIVEYQRHKAQGEVRKELHKRMNQMIKDEDPVKEIMATLREQMKKNCMAEHDVVVMAWNSIMSAVEWNKKEELVADQALKHLRAYTPLLKMLTESGRSEIILLQKVQEYCVDNMNFIRVFQKIVVLFYKADVLSEDAILKWRYEAHLPKGKSVFLEQMKGFIEWLENAEEEESDDDEEEEEG